LAVVTFYQLRASREATKIEQRAWLQARIEVPEQLPREGMFALAKAVITNTGKTPATKMQIVSKVLIVDHSEEPRLVLGGAVRVMRTGIHLPERGEDVLFLAEPSTNDPRKGEPRPITKEEIARLKAGQAYFVFFSRVTYSDVFGDHHFTQACAWKALVDGDYPAYDCSQYNQIDMK
jgi:hypothetical protein